MCMQDIRIGQSLAARQRASGVPTIAVPVQLMTPDPNRARLAVASTLWAQLTNGAIAIRADSATGPNIASLSFGQPSVMLTVEEYGMLITGAVWAVNTIDNGVNVDASDLVLTPRSADA